MACKFKQLQNKTTITIDNLFDLPSAGVMINSSKRNTPAILDSVKCVIILNHLLSLLVGSWFAVWNQIIFLIRIHLTLV